MSGSQRHFFNVVSFNKAERQTANNETESNDETERGEVKTFDER